MPAGYSPGTGLSCARGCAAGRCSAIGLFCVRFVPGVRSYRNVLRSITPAVCRIAPNRTACGSVARFAFVHAGVCGAGGAVCRHSRRGWQFYCGVLPSVHAGACSSIAVFCRRFTPGVRFYCSVLPSVHACLFSFVRKKETACDMLRSYSAGSRSPFVRSRGALRLSASVGSLRACAFFYGDLDELPGTRGTRNGAGGAALVGLCASTLAL